MTSTKSVWTFLPGVLALSLVLCSCRKADEAPATGNNTEPATAAAPAQPAAAHVEPIAEKTKKCFECNGAGVMKCPDCQDGSVDCQGECLKLTQGTWIHMEVTGHPPTDIWQKFAKPGGGWTAYNQRHVGHIIRLRNGDWMDAGPCPVCHGKGKIECAKCKGTGEIVCNICEGKKVVPESWTAFDNPKLKNQPGSIALKDGRVLFGKKVFVFGTHATIQTTNGNVEVATADILAENKPNGK